MRCKAFERSDKKNPKFFPPRKALMNTQVAGCAIPHTNGQNTPQPLAGAAPIYCLFTPRPGVESNTIHMGDDSPDLHKISRAQNIFAVCLTLGFILVLVFGGWYLRSHREGATGSQSSKGSGAAASAVQPEMLIGQSRVTLNGEFRMPQSEVSLEFKSTRGLPVDVGQVTLALDMNMPGMVMHDSAELSGSAGHYTAKVKPKMAGDWTAKLSIQGPQGNAEKTFPVTVK